MDATKPSDVVCLKTGDVFAALPYWYQEKETIRDTKLLIRALNRLHVRGGHFFAGPLLQTLSSLEMLVGHDSLAEANEGDLASVEQPNLFLNE